MGGEPTFAASFSSGRYGQEPDNRRAQDGAGSGHGILFDCASGPLPAVEHSGTGPSVAQKRPFDLSRSIFAAAAGNSADKRP